MAKLTEAQIAKRLANSLNDSRWHTPGRNVVKRAEYTSGAEFKVFVQRDLLDPNDGDFVTVTVAYDS